MYKKKMDPNQPLHLFLTRGRRISKIFTLILMIPSFLRHYNKKLGPDPLKQKAILMAYIGKTIFNIDSTTIHLRLNFPLNCKHL